VRVQRGGGRVLRQIVWTLMSPCASACAASANVCVCVCVCMCVCVCVWVIVCMPQYTHVCAYLHACVNRVDVDVFSVIACVARVCAWVTVNHMDITPSLWECKSNECARISRRIHVCAHLHACVNRVDLNVFLWECVCSRCVCVCQSKSCGRLFHSWYMHVQRVCVCPCIHTCVNH